MELARQKLSKGTLYDQKAVVATQLFMTVTLFFYQNVVFCLVIFLCNVMVHVIEIYGPHAYDANLFIKMLPKH